MSLFVYITTPDSACAEQIALTLVDQHLAAGVNILPSVRSLYRWQGSIKRRDEVVLIAKTEPDRLEALTATVKAMHPYECPCIVALPIAGGNPDFLAWINAATRSE